MEARIRELISEADAGSADAAAKLFAALYAELHRLANQQLRRLGSDLALSTTTLVHEAYLDVAGRERMQFRDRPRFMSYAARAMRNVVIDYARRARAKKRGGGAFEITLADEGAKAPATDSEEASKLQRLSEALEELATHDSELARLVDLHFFCGYTFAEIAELRGVSERTVQRDWHEARALLRNTMDVAE